MAPTEFTIHGNIRRHATVLSQAEVVNPLNVEIRVFVIIIPELWRK